MTVPNRLRAGQTAVVTGASGFLGCHLVAHLKSQNVHVRELSRAHGFRLMENAIPLNDVDHVFHLAAETGVLEAWQDPVKFHLVNTHGTIRVLDQCRAAKCSMTYVGAYIYGTPLQLPIAESHPVHANNPYAFSKWMAEQACQWYADTYGLSVTAIRLFNVYGAGQSERFLIPRIVQQLLDPAVEAIEVMDLKPKRDYLYVTDAVAAIASAMPDRGMHVFNVGSGSSHSVADVIRIAEAVSGLSKRIVDRCETRPNEVLDVLADVSAIRAYCDWRPMFDLRSGIREMVSEMRR